MRLWYGYFSLNSSSNNNAWFLDRDGVIIENRDDYIKSRGEIKYIPGALEAIAKISVMPVKIIIVTNQSAIGRGVISNEVVDGINKEVVNKIVENGGRIDDVYVCPHTPSDNCDCRKPRPGLLKSAIEKYEIDTKYSYFVGDHLTDLMAAKGAGVMPALVLSGRATCVESEEWKKELEFLIHQDLLEMVIDVSL